MKSVRLTLQQHNIKIYSKSYPKQNSFVYDTNNQLPIIIFREVAYGRKWFLCVFDSFLTDEILEVVQFYWA